MGRTVATYTAPELGTDPVTWQITLPDAEGRTLLSATIEQTTGGAQGDIFAPIGTRNASWYDDAGLLLTSTSETFPTEQGEET